MLLRFLKSNHVVNYFLFPFIGAGLWLPELVKPQGQTVQINGGHHLFWGVVNQAFDHAPKFKGLFAFLLLLASGYLILAINSRYSFIRIRTQLPATLFIFVASGFVTFHTLHPVWFGALFFLLAIHRLFAAFDQRKPYSQVFDSGFLTGLGSLFYFNLLFVLPAVIAGAIILTRDSRWREPAICTIGALVPWILGLAFIYLSNQLPDWLAGLRSGYEPTTFFLVSDNPMLIFFLAILGLVTLLGSFYIVGQYDEKKVSSRKFFTVLFLFFVATLASWLFVPFATTDMTILTAIPVSFLISNHLVFMKNRFWGELIFLLLAGSSILMQIF